MGRSTEMWCKSRGYSNTYQVTGQDERLSLIDCYRDLTLDKSQKIPVKSDVTAKQITCRWGGYRRRRDW